MRAVESRLAVYFSSRRPQSHPQPRATHRIPIIQMRTKSMLNESGGAAAPALGGGRAQVRRAGAGAMSAAAAVAAVSSQTGSGASAFVLASSRESIQARESDLMPPAVHFPLPPPTRHNDGSHT